MKTLPKGAKRRGSALLLALFFMFALFLMSVAFFRLLPTELHSAARSSKSMKGHYAADAGVREAVEWLKNQGDFVAQASIDTYNGAHNSTITDVANGWGYKTNITVENAQLAIYTIVSTSTWNGNDYREIRATVQNRSFAQYAYFVDTWEQDGGLFGVGTDGIQGPMHTNGFFRLITPDGHDWSDGATPWVTAIRDSTGQIIETARMTQAGSFSATDNELGIAGDGIQWVQGNYLGTSEDKRPYDTSGNSILLDNGVDDRYDRLIEGGRENIKQVTAIEMPESNVGLKAKAWDADGSESAGDFDYPGNNWNNDAGVYVNTNAGANVGGGTLEGGIYVEGDGQMTLSTVPGHGAAMDSEGNGNELWKMTVKHGNTTVVTGETTDHYWLDITTYWAWVPQPDREVELWGDCIDWETRTRDIEEVQDCSGYVTEVNGAECGYTQEVSTDPGTLGEIVDVPNECTFWEECEETVVVGTEEYEECIAQEFLGYDYIPQPDLWQEVDSSYPGATAQTDTIEVDPDDYPDDQVWADVTQTSNTTSINRHDSVIEVNDNSYKIPFPGDDASYTTPDGGVYINGDLITDPADPRLIVPDGSTIHINNDTTKSNRYYGEYTVMSGRTNGIVYSDNNIWDLRGVNKGAKYVAEGDTTAGYHGRTIATDLSKVLEIEGHIDQYYGGTGQNANGDDLNNGSNRLIRGRVSPSEQHVLGILSKDIYLDVENWNSHEPRHWVEGGTHGPLTVYAVLMAGRKNSNGSVTGGFGVRSNDMGAHDGIGEFRLYGGLITGNSRQTTQKDTANDENNGWRLDLNYDWIAANSLMNFPNTQTFRVLRYVERPVGV